jgi:hypothetical protein
MLLRLLVLAAAAFGVHGSRGKWRGKIDWDAIERQLEEGDEAELVPTEDELLIAEMDRRRAQPIDPPSESG